MSTVKFLESHKSNFYLEKTHKRPLRREQLKIIAAVSIYRDYIMRLIGNYFVLRKEK